MFRPVPLILLSVLPAAIVAADSSRGPCEPGAWWKEECNFCSCSARATFVTCSAKDCGDESAAPQRPNRGSCDPGATWAENCNTCTCHDSGHFLTCTAKDCSKQEAEADSQSEEDDEDSGEEPDIRLTKEGETQLCAGETECPADCNYVTRNDKCIFCECGPRPLKPGEFEVSTSKGCPPGTVVGQQLGETQTCVPGGPGRTAGAGCPHGPSFIDECDNDCICTDNQFYGCTRKACRPGQKSEKPLACKGSGDLPKRNDQRVFCHEGIAKMQDEKAACLPGSTFMDGCNSCTCSDTGGADCTRKHCPPEKEPKSRCTHGQEFIDECGNHCSCRKGEFYGCTFKGCPDGARPEVPMSCKGPADLPHVPGRRVFCLKGIVRIQDKEENCLPGAEFMDECNTCTCSDAGVPGCTFKACLPKQSGGGACAHGPEFIDECNSDCKCIDNKFYACSRKACKPGERPEVPMTCTKDSNLPKRPARRVFCHEGKVKLQDKDADCLPGSRYMNECNQCFCSDNGVAGCSMKACS